jgi:V/A-type H+-transporting ATPase subunit I
LEPEELKRCIAVGVVSLPLEEVLPTYLRRFEDLSYKVVEVSAERGYLYIFGPEERREWVEVLFQLFDVEDIFQLLGTRDVLLALSSERREEVIAQYEKEGEEYKRVIEAERRRLSELAGKVRRLHLSLPDRRVPVLRTTVVSILQGWIPEEGEERLNEIVRGLEEKTGELFFIQYEEPSEEDHPIPTPAPRLKPSFLQPAWTLTSLRGWPSAHEVNPAYITILIFSLQFGLMFGDVGQGAVFLILGLILTRKFKRGLANKLGTLFIPMGISAMIFGFLYGDVFLMHLLHPILFSPMKKIGKLMKMVLGIAVAEMCLGLSLGAINHVKEGEPIGVIGERGLGGILFLIGLYFGGLYFLKVGDVFKFFNHWSFYLMIGGLVLATLEPILVAIRHKHFGMEAIGEGIGALMMTFVESLANFFSFLRIAAFALAHAGLAIAAHSLAHFMGPGGLVLTNVIAMTFEFVSSSVQSLRLLYYEFMGKFFHGGGAPFRPYRVR